MRIGSFTLKPGRPAIMGIVNVTPDSFSDGGRYADARSAIDRALELEREGADIIDVGGESTRPGAAAVAGEEELERVVPVVAGIRRASSVPVSIDTTKSAVAAAAIDAGADMINDISAGLADEAMLGLAAARSVPICLMHMKGTPRTMQIDPAYDDLMGEISAFLRDAIERGIAAGVAREMIAVDPGIGFGKTLEHNLTIIRRLGELSSLEAPIVIGTSRKSFIGKLLDLEVNKRLEGSLATFAASIQGGAAILRVHDVCPARRFLDMYMAVRP